MKLVSVIMPAFNGEKYLNQAIDSLISQSYSNWELVVVDDGSQDETAVIVANYSDPRIRYFYQENKGQAAALNKGLELARGDYITTLDTDDWLTPESLLERVSFLEDHADYGAVYGDGYYCDASGRALLRFSEYRENATPGDIYDTLISTPIFGTGANVMVRRDVIDTYQIRYDESIVWCQDYDFYIRIAERTRYGIVDAVVLWYRLHGANMTTSLAGRVRLESLIRTRLKILASHRFVQVSVPAKSMFFHQLLVGDLHTRVEEQTAVLTSSHFQSLPAKEQARLLRFIAIGYLFEDKNLGLVRDLLKKSRSLAPFDLRTTTVWALLHINRHIARYTVRRWHHMNTKSSSNLSPFELSQPSYSYEEAK